ncbi:MAG: UPF0182 family membrane protein [Acidimicrobiales bacterium]
MRAQADMPRRRRRTSGRGRVLIVVAAVVLFILFTSLRGVAGFYTDYLWFDNLGLSEVWSGILGAKIALGVIFTAVFFVLCFVNLTIADRTAPAFRPPGPEDEMLSRYHDLIDRRAWLVRGGVSLLFGLIAGVGVSAEWNQWILFTHSKPFGINDATFKTDVSFYIFRLPFYQSVVQWLFASLIIILLITVVADYLNGGIRLQTPMQRVTPQVKAHISVLLALLSLVKAADYWLQRYALTFSTRGFVEGATYTDVKAQLPALNLLIFIALLSCGLFIYNIWRRGWVLPVMAVGLWALVVLVAGTAYPAFVQKFQVLPTESSKEAPYIANNIAATRQALNMTKVESQQFDPQTAASDTSAAIQNNPRTVQNIRLLDPTNVKDTYQKQQSNLGYTTFNDLDVDRYQVTTPQGDSAPTAVVLSTRDLSGPNVPQKSWEGQHISYTHGYGLALSAANAVSTGGSPDYLIRDVPTAPHVEPKDAQVQIPQVYFSENQSGYSIVGSTRDEVDYLDQNGATVSYRYDGKGGVAMNSWLRKAAFAARFGDWNPLISNFVTDQSKILYVRDIRERVNKVAPFLQYDNDPYPVLADGRIQYVIDAYTTSDHYPNAQKASTEGLAPRSGLNTNFNYVRNSVKVIVDAYEGTVKMYVIDPTDPIIQAYKSAFPKLFTDMDQLPETLRVHLRYPEDLFKVQTTMWGRYHIDDAQSFYDPTNGWNVAKDPGTTVGGATQTVTTNAAGQTVRKADRKIDPYYLIMKLPGEQKESFVLFRSFVPTSDDDTKQKLTAFMVANSDPDNYGQLQVYEVPSQRQVAGPSIVNSAIQANPLVSSQVSLLNQNGSSVTFGNLLLIPIENSLLYVRPLYVSSDQNRQPLVQRVIVAYEGPDGSMQISIRETLRLALQELFPDVPKSVFNGVGGTSSSVTQSSLQFNNNGAGGGGGSTTTTTQPSTSSTPSTGEPSGTVDGLISQAADILAQAQANLSASCQTGVCDLTAYQNAVKQAGDLLAQAKALSATNGGGGGGAASTTTTTTTGTSA